MYSKSYVGGDQPPEKIKIPPDYDGSALLSGTNDREQADDRDCKASDPDEPNKNHHIQGKTCDMPKKSGILDKFKTEDIILLAAAAFLIFREENDILSLGILILIILL